MIAINYNRQHFKVILISVVHKWRMTFTCAPRIEDASNVLLLVIAKRYFGFSISVARCKGISPLSSTYLSYNRGYYHDIEGYIILRKR